MQQQWRADLAGLDPATCILLDETSTQITLTRTRSRAPRGCRAVEQIPRNHGQNLSCLMAIRPTGVLAPLVVPGAVDGQVFYQWITTWLLQLVPTGTTIILDNLAVHRHPRVRHAVAAAGCHLQFPPPYSPHFNPIEFVFAKLKAHLRRVAARTPDTVIAAIGSGLDLVTTTDLANCDRHFGYPLPDC